MYKRLLTIITIAGVFTMTSCKKEVDSDTQTAVDNGISENAYARVAPTVHRIAIGEAGVEEHVSNLRVDGTVTCATVTLSDTNASVWPKTITIDYGNGCIDPSDLKLKAGIIRAVIDQYWDNSGAKFTVSFDNYKEAGMEIGGAITLTNNGAQGTAKNISMDVVGGFCKTANWDIDYDCSRDYNFIDLNNTPSDLLDDVVEITGDASGVNRKDRSYTMKVTEKLVKNPDCEFIAKGIVEVTPEGLATRTIDFGDGTCDNKATVTVNGNTFEFQLK